MIITVFSISFLSHIDVHVHGLGSRHAHHLHLWWWMDWRVHGTCLYEQIWSTSRQLKIDTSTCCKKIFLKTMQNVACPILGYARSELRYIWQMSQGRWSAYPRTSLRNAGLWVHVATPSEWSATQVSIVSLKHASLALHLFQTKSSVLTMCSCGHKDITMQVQRFYLFRWVVTQSTQAPSRLLVKCRG